MRKILPVVMLIAVAHIGSAQAPRPAEQLVAAGVEQARAQNKNVLVEFGASWCGWCHRFDKFLATPDAGKIMHQYFVVVPLVALEQGDKRALNNPGAEALLERQSGGSGGIPFFYILDQQNKVIGDSNALPDHSNIGHPNTPQEIEAFDKLLERTAPRMTAAERKTVHNVLVEMAKNG